MTPTPATPPSSTHHTNASMLRQRKEKRKNNDDDDGAEMTPSNNDDNDSSLSSSRRRVKKKLFSETPTPLTLFAQNENNEDSDEDSYKMEFSTRRRSRGGQLIKDGFEFDEAMNYFWSFVLGLAGLLDLLACLLPSAVHTWGWVDEYDGILLFPTPEEQVAQEAYHDNILLSTFLAFVQWLHHKDVSISFCFSFLWFMDAFLDAHARRARILQQEERDYYLAASEEDDDDERYNYNDYANSNDEDDEFDDECNEKEAIIRKSKKKKKLWWKTASFVYYRTILVQMLLLPVGFYLLMYYEMVQVWHGHNMEGDMEHIQQELIVEVDNEDDGVQYYETFNATSKISLLFAILHHLSLTSLGTTNRVVRARIVSAIRSFGFKMAGRAVRNPLKFRHKARQVLTALRWVKYLAPLIGAGNKLKGNVSDMIKKFRQRRIAQKQKRIRQLLWGKKATELQEEDAAIMIQTAWRAHVQKRHKVAMMAFRGDQHYFASMQIQGAFRSRLARVRVNFKARQQELAKLKKMKEAKGRHKVRLSEEEKKRFYELQDEMDDEMKDLLNRRLLLRPNTRFAVAWKILFIFCVSLEILRLAIKPKLESYKKRKKDDPLTMEELVGIQFVPTRMSEYDSCKIHHESEGPTNPLLKRAMQRRSQVLHEKLNDGDPDTDPPLPWYCKAPVSTVQEGLRDCMALALVPAPTEEWSDCTDKPPKTIKDRFRRKKRPEERPWYCGEKTKKWHRRYRLVVDFLVEEFLLFVGIVCFMDVFVTFFTGEFDPTTGELIPKPWFPRWVLPGLILQLLVNPTVSEVAAFLGKARGAILTMGPVRVFRWSAAVIFPASYWLWHHFFLQSVWIPLVEYENQVEEAAYTLFSY